MPGMRYGHMLFGLALLLAAGHAPVRGQADAENAKVTAEIRTSATGEQSVRPDFATFTISFTAKGRTPALAGRAVAARADSLRVALQSLGIPRDSLVSGSRWRGGRGRLEPTVTRRCVRNPTDPDEVPCHNVQDTSYIANESIEARIHDIQKVGAAIDSVVAHGMTEISAVSFQATDVSEAREAALRDATQRARRHAVAIAEAGGGILGRTLLLATDVERSFSRMEAVVAGSYSAEGTSGTAGTEVIQPRISVSVTVFGRWELLPKP